MIPLLWNLRTLSAELHSDIHHEKCICQLWPSECVLAPLLSLCCCRLKMRTCAPHRLRRWNSTELHDSQQQVWRLNQLSAGDRRKLCFFLGHILEAGSWWEEHTVLLYNRGWESKNKQTKRTLISLHRSTCRLNRRSLKVQFGQTVVIKIMRWKEIRFTRSIWTD